MGPIHHVSLWIQSQCTFMSVNDNDTSDVTLLLYINLTSLKTLPRHTPYKFQQKYLPVPYPNYYPYPPYPLLVHVFMTIILCTPQFYSGSTVHCAETRRSIFLREEIYDISYTEAEFMNIQFRWGFCIILRVLRLEVSVHNVYITNQFQTTFARGGGGGKIC